MNNFIKKESPHYDFFVFENSVALKEIDEIIQTQENSYKKILDFINTKNDRKIKYFLYPSNRIKAEMTDNDGNGHALRDEFEVHAVYNDKVKCIGPHEDTHLLVSFLGLPPQLFREGLAEYLSGTWDGQSHDKWVSKFIVENKVPELVKVIDDEEWYELDDTISYPSAGSFIGFLIQKIGKEEFLKLYKALNRDFDLEKNKSIFERITNLSITEAQDQWLSKLGK